MQRVLADPPNRLRYLGYLKNTLIGSPQFVAMCIANFPRYVISFLTAILASRGPKNDFGLCHFLKFQRTLSNSLAQVNATNNFCNFYKTSSFLMQNTIYSVFFDLRHPLLKPFQLSLSFTRCLFGLHVPTVSLWSRVGWHFKVKESRD